MEFARNEGAKHPTSLNGTAYEKTIYLHDRLPTKARRKFQYGTDLIINVPNSRDFFSQRSLDIAAVGKISFRLWPISGGFFTPDDCLEENR